MNAKQSLRVVSQRLEQLEYFNHRAAQDIRNYNRCIEHMMAGGSPCDWCDDLQECRLKAKEEGKGCDEWILCDPEKKENQNE